MEIHQDISFRDTAILSQHSQNLDGLDVCLSNSTSNMFAVHQWLPTPPEDLHTYGIWSGRAHAQPMVLQLISQVADSPPMVYDPRMPFS